jgi:hypothetical protein
MTSNRRSFIKHLLVTFGSLTTAALAVNRSTALDSIKLATLKVAGLQYGEWPEHLFEDDESLVMVREADNKYDRYAIALYYKGKKAGYIPRTNSRIIASLMDGGEELEARVRYFDSEKRVYERLWVSVWMRKGKVT